MERINYYSSSAKFKHYIQYGLNCYIRRKLWNLVDDYEAGFSN